MEGGLGGSEAYSKLSSGEGMLRQVEISKTINEKKTWKQSEALKNLVGSHLFKCGWNFDCLVELQKQ